MAAQKPWSMEQRLAIFEALWHDGRARCPVDDTSLRSPGIQHFVDNYLVEASCPRCGNAVEMGPKDDPLETKFRTWTQPEKLAIGDQILDRRSPRCPVDGAPLKTVENKFGTPRTFVSARCGRCGQECEEWFPREEAKTL